MDNVKIGDNVWCYDKWNEIPMKAGVTGLYECQDGKGKDEHLNGQTVAKLHAKGWNLLTGFCQNCSRRRKPAHST